MREPRDVTHQIQYEDLAFSIVRIAYKLLGGDRMSMNYGTDVEIHGSEIHILCHIKDHPDSHISEIARNLGVTRGAVSQIVAKLKRKGLIEKAEAKDGRCIIFKLTQKGETAYLGHQKIHFLFIEHIEKIMEYYPNDQISVVLDFFNKLETSVEDMLSDIKK